MITVSFTKPVVCRRDMQVVCDRSGRGRMWEARCHGCLRAYLRLSAWDVGTAGQKRNAELLLDVLEHLLQFITFPSSPRIRVKLVYSQSMKWPHFCVLASPSLGTHTMDVDACLACLELHGHFSNNLYEKKKKTSLFSLHLFRATLSSNMKLIYIGLLQIVSCEVPTWHTKSEFRCVTISMASALKAAGHA